LFIATAFSVINLIAVADVETLLGAVVPDRVLNKTRKRPWKAPVELPGVDLLGDRFGDFGAAAGPIAGEAIGVIGSEPAQDPGPVQEIVHQRVDRDHAAANLEPPTPITSRAEKQLSQRHRQHFVGNAVDLFQRVKQGRSHSGQPVGPGELGGGIQTPVDPTDEVAASNVANEEMQRVGSLIQPTVAQPVIGQGAVRQMFGLGAGVSALVTGNGESASSF
jgi:hypothetical protein